MKGLLIHIGDYFRPSIIDTRRPYEYKIKYAKFEDGKVAPDGFLHRDPEFNSFTYGDYPDTGAKANLGRLNPSDFIFFNCTFLEKDSGEKTRYIVGYFKLAEILTIEEVLRRSLGDKEPYCNNEHVKKAVDLIWEEAGSIFIGDPKQSRQLKVPLRLDKDLVQKLELRDRTGKPISSQFGRKRNKRGKLMSEIEIINVYTRNPKILDDRQVQTLLEEIRKVGN